MRPERSLAAGPPPVGVRPSARVTELAEASRGSPTRMQETGGGRRAAWQANTMMSAERGSHPRSCSNAARAPAWYAAPIAPPPPSTRPTRKEQTGALCGGASAIVEVGVPVIIRRASAQRAPQAGTVERIETESAATLSWGSLVTGCRTEIGLGWRSAGESGYPDDCPFDTAISG